MSRTSTIVVIIIGIVIIAGGAWYVYSKQGQEPALSNTTFSCDAGKTIAATFYKDKVSLVLSDGRMLTEPQVISGSGARYANKDETFVFWNKGNTAFITEGSPAVQTFSNCVAPDANGNITQTYASTTMGVSLQYTKGYAVDETYAYDQFGPKKLIHGVSFTIPESMATGTNLSDDTRLSVEQLPNAKNCTGDIFLQANVKAQSVTDGADYSVATSSDAAAGNRYEETVYALKDSHPCTAIRYFVHYGAIENYPAGAVNQFDAAALMSALDTVRRSVVLNQSGSTTTP